MRFEFIFLVVFLLINLIFFAGTLDLQFILKNGNLGAGFLPRMVTIGLIILTLFYTSLSLLKNEQSNESTPVTKSALLRQLFLIGCMVISIFLVDVLGMMTTIALMITVILFVIERVPLLKSFGFGIASAACFYLVFVQWMNLKLPTGIFI